MSDKIILNYKYLLQPNKQQQLALWRTLQSCRHQYNEGLELWNECYECAKAGIKAIIQPGGSLRDQESIDACDEHGIAMVFSGIRHFKH